LSYADHLSYKHNLALELSKYAYFAGAKYIEKHVCIKNNEELPDYHSAINIDEFKRFYKEMKFLDIILGKNNVSSLSIDKYVKKLNIVPMVKNVVHKEDVITSDDLIYRRSSTDKANLISFNKYIPCEALKSITNNEILDNTRIKRVNITAVIVSRFQSSRLEGKCIKKINGIESIIRCINNVKRIKYINNIVLATSSNKENKILIEIAKQEKIEYVVGSEDDVLERYILAGNKTKAVHIVRVGGDCPCVSYEIADILINSHLKENKDMTLALPSTYGLGLSCEIYKLSSLKLLNKKLSEEGKNLTEYLSLFMPFNTKTFNINIVKLPNIFSKYLKNKIITLDTEYDYKLINDIYQYNNVKSEAISYNQINNYFINNEVKENERIVGLGTEEKMRSVVLNFNKYGNIDGNEFIPLKGNYYEELLDFYNKQIIK
jgi:spore coat polysaccharide biosynthesis protein SpsF (cytidylyltransferase family)